MNGLRATLLVVCAILFSVQWTPASVHGGETVRTAVSQLALPHSPPTKRPPLDRHTKPLEEKGSRPPSVAEMKTLWEDKFAHKPMAPLTEPTGEVSTEKVAVLVSHWETKFKEPKRQELKKIPYRIKFRINKWLNGCKEKDESAYRCVPLRLTSPQQVAFVGALSRWDPEKASPLPWGKKGGFILPSEAQIKHQYHSFFIRKKTDTRASELRDKVAYIQTHTAEIEELLSRRRSQNWSRADEEEWEKKTYVSHVSVLKKRDDGRIIKPFQYEDENEMHLKAFLEDAKRKKDDHYREMGAINESK